MVNYNLSYMKNLKSFLMPVFGLGVILVMGVAGIASSGIGSRGVKPAYSFTSQGRTVNVMKDNRILGEDQYHAEFKKGEELYGTFIGDNGDTIIVGKKRYKIKEAK